MITKEDFIELIQEHLNWGNRIDEVAKLFNWFPYGASWIEYSQTLFFKILSLQFNAKGIDDITWWLFEKIGNRDLKMYENGKEIPTETIEDLWNIVKENRI